MAEGADDRALVEVRLLGPVAVAVDGDPVDLPVPRHRALLAALALHHPDVVTTSELIDALWGDDPPASADKTLQGYVSALRRSFGIELIDTVPAGYRLGPSVERVDAIELDTLVATGRRDLAQGNHLAAHRSFRSALALWRGRPLGDLAPGPARDGQIARLDELRLLASEGLVTAELELGHHREVVPDLQRLVAEQAYRELLWQDLMLALYRSGRAAEALEAYRNLRTMLREELGIDPSEATQALEARILARDPQLDPPQQLPRTNLRVPLDTFVGRDREQREILTCIDEHRLVTLIGLGGVGKSRLANEVGRAVLRRASREVWWVDLAAMPATRTVIGQVAAAMGLAVSGDGNRERALLGRLRRMPAVLVLDNCEHVRDDVASFVEWATSNDPLVRILATSRRPLEVAGEQRVFVEPLGITAETGEQISDAARLFVDRVTELTGTTAVEVAEAETITDLVGGLPLGIELAAAQCRVRAPLELARMLDDRDSLLSLSGSTAGDRRHASLGLVLETSVAALPADAAAAAPRLTVFPGDFDLTAAAPVLELPLGDTERILAALLDGCLLTPTRSDGARRRFRMLRPVHEYLVGVSDAQARERAEAAHARHFYALARRQIDDADTPAHPVRMEEVRIEDHNLRVALAWYERNDPAGALTFAPALGDAWMNSGDQVEGRDTLRRLLATAPDAPSHLVAWTEDALVWLELLSGDLDAAVAHNLDSIARFDRLGDTRGRSRALRSQAHGLYLAGVDEATTTPIYQRSIELARAAGLDYAQALTEVSFAQALTCNEALDVVDIEAMLSHAESVLRAYGAHVNLAQAALSRAFIAFGRSDPAATRAAGDEMLRQSRLAGALVWEQVASIVLGVAAHATGDEPARRQHLRDAVRLAIDTDNVRQLGIALHAVAATSAARAPADAARLWGAADTLTPLWPLFTRRYGEWMRAAGEALGERYGEFVSEGVTLTVDDTVALADRLL